MNTTSEKLKKEIARLEKKRASLRDCLVANPYSDLLKLYEAFNEFKQEIVEKYNSKTKTLADDLKLKSFIREEKNLRKIIEMQKGTKLRDELFEVEKKLDKAYSDLFLWENK